jgi:hypothetical protein
MAVGHLIYITFPAPGVYDAAITVLVVSVSDLRTPE